MRVFLVILCFFYGAYVFAQELKELRHTITNDFKYDFYVSFSEKKMKYEDTLHYFWFKAQKIHVSQGSSEGRLLDGPFTGFYHSGQLSEQGEFVRGLKDGEWKEWYESGKLKSIYNYKEGILAGDYTLYNEAGDIRETGKIKKGVTDIDEAETPKQKSGKRAVREALKKTKKDQEEETKKEQTEIGEKKSVKDKRIEREQNRLEKKRQKELKKKDPNYKPSLFERLFKLKKKPNEQKSPKENGNKKKKG